MAGLKVIQRLEQRPLVRERNVSVSDEGPLLEKLDFFEISHCSYQPSNFLHDLTLSTKYSILIAVDSGKYYKCTPVVTHNNLKLLNMWYL